MTFTKINPATAAAQAARRPGLVLAAICACTVLVVGFVAAVNLAVPLLAAGSLHPSAAGLLWIVDAYVVFFACLVIPGGAVGDRYGRKGVLLAGLGLFAAGALLSAVAPSVPAMLAGRAVTGLGAACVLPNTVAVLINAMPPERRPRAIATWASMTGIGGAIGNVGGGALLSAGSWRWLFGAMVPVALVLAAWVAAVAPRTARHQRPLRPASALLLTVASLALLLAIIGGPEDGWLSPQVAGGFAAAAVLYATWTWTELRAEHPLLDPRLFRIPRLRSACLGILVIFFGMFSLFYVNASFLQYAKGFTVLEAGLGIVPMTVALIFGGRLAARIPDHAAPRVVALAFALIGGALLGLSSCGASTNYAWWALLLVLIGAGLTVALPRLTADITSSLPAQQAGLGGGLQSTTREFGSALGVAVIGTIVTARFSAAAHGARTVPQALATQPHAAVITAYAASADAGLRVMGLLVLIVGAIVSVPQLLIRRAAQETGQPA
jgi:MFS family permease